MLGFIGGTGLYDLPGLRNVRYERVPSPFGRPSDDVLLGELDGQPLAFLPRHGRGHVVPPHLINYRANLDVFKRLGVTDVVSLSAVGSLREDLPPGTFVLVDQFVDRTRARVSSFFGEGLVARADRLRHYHVGNQAFTEERRDPGAGPVHELVHQHEGARRQIFAK